MDFDKPIYEREIQRCIVVDKDMGCGGFSDWCKMPDRFVSQRGIPNDQITFPK